MTLTFRWLGVAGIELKAGDQVLAIDPFFTRPTLWQMLKPLRPDPDLAAAYLPECNIVLVTHAHYDHLLDVPEVLRHTGAVAYGSANTCQLLHILGAPQAHVIEAKVGDRITSSAFQVEVILGQHSPVPIGNLFNGNLRPGLQLPLHVTDYRMDVCLGYRITVMGVRILVCSAEPCPADVLCAVAQETQHYYTQLLMGVQPRILIPIHWDNFTRPISKPLRRFTRPGRQTLGQVSRLACRILPGVQVIVPELFREYTLNE